MVSIQWYLFRVITYIGTYGLLPSSHYPDHRRSAWAARDDFCSTDVGVEVVAVPDNDK
jgi:hypothetical protein